MKNRVLVALKRALLAVAAFSLMAWVPQTVAQPQAVDKPLGPSFGLIPAAVSTEFPSTLHPDMMWHYGLSDDEDGGPLGHVVNVAIDRANNSYLLDETMVVVKMLDTQGNFVRTISQQGEGPGEINMPRQVTVMPDGTIGIVQRMPARIVLLDNENTPLGSFPTPDHDIGMQKVSQVRSSARTTVISRSLSTIRGNQCSTLNRLEIYDEVGVFLASAIDSTVVSLSQGMTIDNGREFNPLATCWDVADDGRLFVAPYYNEYRILVFDSAGSPLGVIQAEYESVRRSPENLAELKQQSKDYRKYTGGSLTINPFVRDISELYCRPNGDLWVLSSQGVRDCPDHQIGVFHVYDRNGHYLRDVALDADYDPDRDDFAIVGDHLFILKESRMMPATLTTARYGESMVAISRGARDDDENDDDEFRPYSVICYALP